MATHGAREVRSYNAGKNAPGTMDRKSVLKRARRRSIRGGRRAHELLVEQDMPALGIKPLDQWDVQELAHGKPRNADGKFRNGPMPRWMNDEIRGEIEKRYRQATGERMNVAALESIVMARKLMRRASSEPVRLDASKFFIEQVFGKAVQKVAVEGALKVEALLGVALVNPDGSPAYGFRKALADTDEEMLDAEAEG